MYFEDNDYFINEEEVPKCEKMFSKNFPGFNIVHSRFTTFSFSNQECYVVIGEKDGEKVKVFFVLDYYEDEGMVELIMLDTTMDEIDSEEIHYVG